MDWKFTLSAVLVALLLVGMVTDFDFGGMFISTKTVKSASPKISTTTSPKSTSISHSGTIHTQKAPPAPNVPKPFSGCGASVNESGNYYLVNNVSSNLSSTCVDILHDNVVFNCQGYRISNSGVAVNTHGYSNITIVNCDFFDNAISIYNPNLTGYTIAKNNLLVDSTHWDVYSLNPIMINSTLFGKTSSAATKFNITGTGLAIHITNRPNIPNGYVGSENFFIMTNLSSGSWAQVFEYYNESRLPANESTLEMWKYNTSWHKLPGTDLDTDENMVYSGNVTSFSTFGVLGLPLPVTGCANLTNASKTYILTKNISGVQAGRDVCIDIQANNITLNGNGYSMSGNGSGKAVYMNGHNGTTVENMLISNYTAGIKVVSAINNTFKNNSLTNNRDGITLGLSSNYNTLANNILTNNTYDGIGMDTSTNNLLTNNTASGNLYGIHFGTLSNNNILSNNNASFNRNYGMYIVSSPDNVFANNILDGNSVGIYITSSSHNTLTNNTLNSNGMGIEIITSSNNTLTNNVLFNTNNVGIYLDTSSNNTLTNNIANSNGVGISIYHLSSNNTLINNTANNNTMHGLYFFVSSNNTITNNTANSNGNKGIYLFSSSNNLLTRNSVTNNTLWDFYSINSIGNTVLNLTVNTTTSSFTYKDISIKSAVSPDDIPADYKDLEKYMRITNTSKDSWIHLNISYTDSDVTSKNIDESTIRLWRFNGTWQSPQTAATVNTVNTKLNYVHSEISSFSIFTLIGKEITPVTTTSSSTTSSSSTIQPPLVCSNGIAYYYFHKVLENETVMPDKVFCNDLRINYIIAAENLYQSEVQISSSSNGEPAQNVAYKYFNFNSANLNNSQLKELSFELRVNKSWISENNIAPSTVRAYNYNKGWERMDTNLVYNDKGYYYYHINARVVPTSIAVSGSSGVDFWTAFNTIQQYYNGEASFADVVDSVDVYYST